MAEKTVDMHTHAVYLWCPYKAHLLALQWSYSTWLHTVSLYIVWANVVMFYCINAHHHEESTMVLLGNGCQ